MRVIRKTSFTVVPWKNGGGITHEVIRVPPTGDAFRWRVSVAEIDASGPFSDFSNYNRAMVLLRGAGVRLTFDGREHTVLRTAGDMVQFDGARSTRCDLADGPCADLNLMVSKSMQGVHAWVESLQAPRNLSFDQGTTLVFPISGSVSMATLNGEFETLQAWDLAVLRPSDAGTVRSAARDASAASLVFFATLGDNLPE
jgi:environmental stress-induced protein Ves